MIGLPAQLTACLFDLDGVLTSTAVLHRAAWRETFDDFLRQRDGATFVPFSEADYLSYVDGRPRFDGVREFLASRGIVLPEGEPSDPPDADTVHGVGNRKNELVQKIIAEGGVTPYPGSVRYLEAARATPFIQARVDGLVIAREGLAGKPAPDSFLAGARALGIPAANAAVFEDALAGVQAGKAGGFGYVVGVDRVGQAEQLRAMGADVVVTDLAELLEERP